MTWDGQRTTRKRSRGWAMVVAGALVVGGVVMGPATAQDRSTYLVTISTDVPMPNLTVDTTLATGDGFVVVEAQLTQREASVLASTIGVLGIEADGRVELQPLPAPPPASKQSPPSTQDAGLDALCDTENPDDCPPVVEDTGPKVDLDPVDNPSPGTPPQRYRYPKYSWGVDSLDSGVQADSENTDPNRDVVELYRPPADGTGVNVYVLDTGIAPVHREFSGRIGTGWDVFQWDNTPDDLNPPVGEPGGCPSNSRALGHGTATAGIVASDIYGVARGATVHPVRVLDCDGIGYFSEVILGLEWVKKNAIKPAIVNMSLSGPFSAAQNAVVAELTQAGIAVVAAAGNAGGDACNYSPGSAPTAITVAAVEFPAVEASYSNFGSCVDLFAPGTAVRTSLPEGARAGSAAGERMDVDGVESTGTSMAAPHVAGALAVYWSMNPEATLGTVTSGLLGTAKTDAVSLSQNRLEFNTPNRLVSVSFPEPPASPLPPSQPPTGNPVPPTTGIPEPPAAGNPSPPTTGTTVPPRTTTTTTTRSTTSNPAPSSSRFNSYYDTYTPSSSYADPVTAENYSTEYYQTSPFATQMPNTGGNPGPPAAVALALLVMGLAMLAVGRQLSR